MVSVNWNILAVSVRTINVTGGSGEDNRMTTKIRVPKWLDVVINLIDLQFVATLMNLLFYQTGYNSRFHLL